MKKAGILLFLLCYLFTAAGFSINLHYCGGKVKSVSLFHTDERNCCGNKMKKKDCCKEKNVSVKINDNQSHSPALQIPGPQFTTLIFVAPVNSIFTNVTFVSQIIPLNHAPPDLFQAPPYLKNGVLLI